MPYPNEHAARQKDPSGYDRFARSHPKGWPAGVDAIYGIKNGKSEIQAVRFDKSKWTVDAAKKWLKENGFKTSGFEPAAKKVTKNFWRGVL